MKKNIVFLIGGLSSGGSERQMVNIINKLVDTYTITILCLYNSEIFYPINPNVKILFLKKEFVPSKNIINAIKLNSFFIYKVYKYCKNINADTIISFSISTNIYSIIVAKFLRKKSIIREIINPNSYKNKFWKILRRCIFPYCNYLVVQSNEMYQFFTSFIPLSKLIKINNNIDDSLLNKIKPYSSNRENIILAVGRLSEQKNFNLLINAFCNLNIQNWKLYIVGEGELKEKLENKIYSLNIQNNVFLLGSKQNIDEYYNKAKIFVLTSTYEGFPNVLIEAMCFGLPCIASNCKTGPNEIIQHETNGYLFENNNTVQCTYYLNKLITNQDICIQFSLEANKIKEQFTLNNLIKKWETLIK